MKGLGVGREIKRDVSKRPLGISSPCWCNSGGGWSAEPGMHEEFQSNWEGVNDQYKRRTLCNAKVILKGSTIVTCYLLVKSRRGRQRRLGRSGKTTAHCFLGEVRRTPSLGLKLSASPLPGALSPVAASHVPRNSPDRSGNLSRSPKGLPWPRQTPILCGPFLSHFHPQETQVSNFELPRNAGAAINPARRGAPAPPRCLAGVA